MTFRWHWGTGIALVYASFAVATVGFAVYAMDQRVDLVSEDYYAHALGQDRHMAAVANAAALGDAFRLDVSEDGRLVTLTWIGGARPDGGGTATLYRPSSAAADRMLAVAPDSLGVQRIDLARLPAGRWQAQIQWRAQGRDYYVERTVVAR
jgi:nitrogen fixation protein FixH